MRQPPQPGPRQRSFSGQSLGEQTTRQGAVSLFTALGLILLTLMVYLFSLSLPDEERHHAVYASLAKAFLFSDWTAPPEPVVQDHRLLTGARQAVWEMAAYLAGPADAPGTDRGTMRWQGDDLVVLLPDMPADADAAIREDTVAHLAQMVVATTLSVQVESIGDGRAGNLSAAAVLAGLLEQAGVPAQRISAAALVGWRQDDGPGSMRLVVPGLGAAL